MSGFFKNPFPASPVSRLFWICLLIAAVLRVYGAWCLRFNLNLDAGVVALMSKHMAEGVDFPFFFYGQAYMGSLEAALGAVFCRVFGVSGLAVNMGTAIPAFLLLWVVYLWARDIAGPSAGLAAMLFSCIGPMGFFHYSVSPRGGYAAVLLFGTLCLWLSSRIVATTRAQDQEQNQGGAPYHMYFWLGLAGGLGWWSGQLVAAALLASLLVLLFGLGRGVLNRGLALVLIGFGCGSLPFWVYNALHGWPTFAFTGSLGRMDMWHGLQLFFGPRFLALTDLQSLPAVLRWAGAGIHLAALASCLYLLGRALCSGLTRQWAGLLAAFFFLLVSALVFSTSHFAALPTSRYLLPLVPILAVFLGVASTVWATRLPRGVAWTPLAFLLLIQLHVLPWAAAHERNERGQQQSVQRIGQYLSEQGVKAAYAPNLMRSWNFALGEQIVFSDLRDDFYAPNARFAELDDHPAVLKNYASLASFLSATTGFAEQTTVDGVQVAHGFVSPRQDWQMISRDEIAAVLDSSGQDIRDLVLAPDMRTSWYSPRRPHDDWIEVRFTRPLMISGLRMWVDHMQAYPRAVRVEGRSQGRSTPDGDEPDASGWEPLLEQTAVYFYYWSGPRPFWFGDHQRLELRFAPRRLSALRIANHTDGGKRQDWRWGMQVLQVFGPKPGQGMHLGTHQGTHQGTHLGAEAGLESQALPELLDLLDGRGIRYLYADRWAANAVSRATSNAVWTSQDLGIFPDQGHPLQHLEEAFALAPPGLPPMILTPRTALLVRAENAASVAAALRAVGESMDATEVGPWVVLDFDRGSWRGSPRAVGLHWTGFGALLGLHPEDYRAVRPEHLAAKGLFYPDNNWTDGDARIIGLDIAVRPEEQYLVLALKGPHPHGQDAATLGLELWVNGLRLAFVRQDKTDFVFRLPRHLRRISTMRIVSRTFVPQQIGLSPDPRTLGVMVEALRLESGPKQP